MAELSVNEPAIGYSVCGVLNRVVAAPLLGALWLYKKLISPALHFAGGPSGGCRFYPTCSVYATEAIRVHGPLIGVFLTTKRLICCTPLHPGGVDFVPSPTALRPRCVRASSTRPPTN